MNMQDWLIIRKEAGLLGHTKPQTTQRDATNLVGGVVETVRK